MSSITTPTSSTTATKAEHASLNEQFASLCLAQGIREPGQGKKSKKKKNNNNNNKRYYKARANFIAEQWEDYYASDSKLDQWRELCEDVGLDNSQLTSITKCKKALAPVWVNIWDLLDAKRNGRLPHRFRSQAELARYTLSMDKIFPLRRAKEGGAARALLAHVGQF